MGVVPGVSGGVNLKATLSESKESVTMGVVTRVSEVVNLKANLLE